MYIILKINFIKNLLTYSYQNQEHNSRSGSLNLLRRFCCKFQVNCGRPRAHGDGNDQQS